MPELQAGQELGPYRLVSRVGAGGFAEIWLAIESGPLGFEKKVALKILRAGTQVGERHFRSLVNEARLAGHLHHAHIVDFYGVARESGLWFMAMEYVQGRSLRGLLRELEALHLSLPHSVILEIGLQVARALRYAHAATAHDGAPLGLIHRDLKPANILVARTGGVKVADFGIAKAATNLQSIVGIKKGTLAYMAPEYWEEAPELGPAVDLFALGAILFELATGRQLFDGETTMAVEKQALSGDPDAEVAEVAARFPALGPVVRGLLTRDPNARMTAAQAEAALLTVLSDSRAPGDLALFLTLMELAQMPRTERAVAGRDVHVPVTNALGWSELAQVLGGGMDTLAPRTQDWLPAVASPSGPTHETWEFAEGSAPALRALPRRPRWLLPVATFLVGLGLGGLLRCG